MRELFAQIHRWWLVRRELQKARLFNAGRDYARGRLQAGARTNRLPERIEELIEEAYCMHDFNDFDRGIVHEVRTFEAESTHG